MLTRLLVAVNVLGYLWEAVLAGNLSAALTGAFSDRTLYAAGALYGPAVSAGQWWRVVTAAFLHAGPTHILFNMLALWQVGAVCEMLYGRARMGLVYALCIAGSGWTVVHFSYNTLTIGASGAIFGLFGAMLAAGLRLGARGRMLVRQTTPIIVINLAIGFFLIPNVSNTGHIGGLVTGFIAGLVLFNVMGPRREEQRAAAAVATIAPEPGDIVQEPPPAQHEAPR